MVSARNIGSWIYFGVGFAVVSITVLAPSHAERGEALAIALLVGVLLYAGGRNGAPAALVAVVGIVAATSAGALATASRWGTTGAPLLVSNLLEAGAQLTMAGGLVILVRQRRGMNAAAVTGDACIVGLGSWLLAWVAFVQPTLAGDDDATLTSLIGGLSQPIGSMILFLMAVYLFTENTTNAAAWFIGAAVSTALIGNVVTALIDTGHLGTALTHYSTSLRMLSYVAIAAALLHPSVRSLKRTQRSGDAHRLLGRLIITTSSLVFPVLVLAASGPVDTVDQVVRSISALVLASAVTIRVVHSVRANSDAQSALIHQAHTDPLTGLPSRALLLDRISSYVDDAWRPDREPTLFYVDLDRFKNINDSLGHAAGDEVLRIVAERLIGVAPPEAMVARLSGDEYVVLDPTSASLGSASGLAERLMAVFREPIALAQGDVFVTASIGVASIDSIAAKPEDVLRHADTAMYRAKGSGRNCIAFFDESMHERIAHRLSVETALYRALDRRELRMFHQPILEINTGEVVGFEALMRWQQSDGTIVSPAEFIPIAEETGTIVPIGAWALLEALTQLRRWIDDGVCSPYATMSVNVSPRQLADPNLPSVVSEALTRSGIDPGLLWIEITESVMISEPELALATLGKMKALGVRVALDDFGTGYSSLSLLQRFPLQRIKIDRAFVQGVADNASDRALVRTIVAMGTSLGLDMVAEGVETLEQMRVLSELGCMKAQGYLISRPVPADAMRSTVSALERLGGFPLLRGEHRAGQL